MKTLLNTVFTRINNSNSIGILVYTGVCSLLMVYPDWMLNIAEAYGVGGGIYGDVAMKSRDKTTDKILDRAEEAVTEKRLGGFITLSTSNIDRETTELQDGYDSEIVSILMGMDQSVDSSVYGGAFSYERSDTDLKTGLGNVDGDTWTLAGYYSTMPSNDIWLSAYLSYSYLDSRKRRRELGGFSVSADVNGHIAGVGLETGYIFESGAFLLKPSASLGYEYALVNGYTEVGDSEIARIYEDDSITSIPLKLGAYTSYATSHDWGVLVPQARLFFVHEFADDARDIGYTIGGIPGSDRTDNPDRNYFILGGTLSFGLKNGMHFFLDAETNGSRDLLDRTKYSLGMRVEF